MPVRALIRYSWRPSRKSGTPPVPADLRCLPRRANPPSAVNNRRLILAPAHKSATWKFNYAPAGQDIPVGRRTCTQRSSGTGREIASAVGRPRRASASRSTTRAICWFNAPGAEPTRRRSEHRPHAPTNAAQRYHGVLEWLDNHPKQERPERGAFGALPARFSCS